MSTLGCRLATPVSIASAVGDAVLKDFVALTKIHGDGWGVAGVDHVGDVPHVMVSAGSALDDPEFVAATREPAPDRVAGPPPLGDQRTRGRAAQLPPVPRRRSRDGAQRVDQTDGPVGRPARARDRGVDARHHRQRALLRGDPSTPACRQRTLAEAVRRAVAQLRQSHPDASLNALAPRRGPADRRPRARPQPAARRGHRGDQRHRPARRNTSRTTSPCASRASARTATPGWWSARPGSATCRGNPCHRSPSSPSRCTICR